MDNEQETPLGRLLGSDEWKIDCTGQAARGYAGRGGKNLVLTHGKVGLVGDGARIQGRMRDGANGGMGGSGYRRGDTCYVSSMATSIPGGGLGVSPHLCLEHIQRGEPNGHALAIHHEWSSDMKFTFNCYRHWDTLVVRYSEESGHFLHSKEGVTQMDPLSMSAYGIGVLHLIQEIRDTHPCTTQPWYADNAGAGGSFGNILETSRIYRYGGHCGDND